MAPGPLPLAKCVPPSDLGNPVHASLLASGLLPLCPSYEEFKSMYEEYVDSVYEDYYSDYTQSESQQLEQVNGERGFVFSEPPRENNERGYIYSEPSQKNSDRGYSDPPAQDNNERGYIYSVPPPQNQLLLPIRKRA